LSLFFCLYCIDPIHDSGRKYFEVGLDYRDGDAFQASNFALSFISCAEDVCREVVIDDTSEEPFTGWELQKDKSRWSQLPSSFF